MQKRVRTLLSRGSEHLCYVGATVISAGVSFVYSVFVKSQIEPLEFGIYSTCLLLQTYMTYVQLGSLNAFNRDYPQLIGAGNVKEATNYRNTTFSFLLLVFSFTTVIISILLLVISNKYDKRYIYGLILCSLITTLTVLENFLSSRVRIDGSFKYTSFVMLTEIVAVLAGFIMIPQVGYYGLYFVTIASMVIGIMMYYKRGVSDLSISINKELLRVIILSGMPLLVNNLIWTIVNSIDKFVILGFIDTEALGLYGIAQMAFSYMVLIPNAMSQLFYVRLGKVYGATKNVDTLNKTAAKYTLLLATLISFMVICAFFLIKPLVIWLMPRYSSGVGAAQILILGLAIYSPTMVNGNILTILKKNAALLRGSLYLCILNVVCSVGLVMIRGASIENVAIGTTISYLIRTVILLYQLKHEARTDLLTMVKASIIPVLTIAGPGVIIYKIVDNIIWGFILSLFIAAFEMMIIYRKSILTGIKEIRE